GGNITGLTNITSELGGKQLELLKEIVAKLNRVAILRTVSSGAASADDVFVKETEVPARALGVQLIPVVIRGPDDFEGAFRAMTKERANGLVNRLAASLYSGHFKRVAETHRPFGRMPEASSHTGMMPALATAAQRITWTRSSRVPSQQTCRLKLQ